MFKSLVSIFIIVLAFNAHGIYRLKPVGLQGGSIGNLGLALIDNLDAAAYNPASIGGLKYDNLSVSGSVLGVSKQKLNEESFKDKTKDYLFNVSSGFLSSLKNYKSANIGFFTYSNYDLNFDKYLTINASGTQGGISYNYAFQSTRAGLILASNYNDYFYFGATLHLDFINSDSRFNTKFFNSLTGEHNTEFQESSSKVTTASSKIGIIYKNFGSVFSAVYLPKGVQIKQEQYRNGARITTTGTYEDKSINRETDETSPEEFGLGYSYTLNKFYSLITEYRLLSNSVSEKTLTTSRKNKESTLGVGMKYNLDSAEYVTFGGSETNIKDLDSKSNAKLIYLSGAYNSKISFINSSFGLHYSKLKTSSDDALEIENAGVILGTSYSY